VAHCGQDEGDLLLVMPDVGGLVGYLHQQQARRGGIGTLERRQAERQLVAKDRDQRQVRRFHFGVCSPISGA
jgi:hypothetical protein